jgi:hypothetical protein
MATPSWTNASAGPVTLTGAGGSFTGPAGPTYTVVDSAAAYGTIAVGANADCFAATANCYVFQISNPPTRPVLHWDASYQETMSDGSTKAATLHVGGSFTDVPTSNPFYTAVETVLHTGITGGCGGTNYCPNNAVTREQMAVFLLKAMHLAGFVPPACTGIFGDVPCPSAFADWIEALANEGITGGCGGGNYCPTTAVTRGQMAVFLLKASHGPSYIPPPCVGSFADVACPSAFADWIEQFAAEGISSGCGGGNFCPSSSVTRGQMAVFLTKAFKMALYQ